MPTLEEQAILNGLKEAALYIEEGYYYSADTPIQVAETLLKNPGLSEIFRQEKVKELQQIKKSLEAKRAAFKRDRQAPFLQANASLFIERHRKKSHAHLPEAKAPLLENPSLVIERHHKKSQSLHSKTKEELLEELKNQAAAINDLFDELVLNLDNFIQALNDALMLLSSLKAKHVNSPHLYHLEDALEEAQQIQYDVKVGKITQEEAKKPLRGLLTTINQLIPKIENDATPQKGLTEAERRLWEGTITSLKDAKEDAIDTRTYDHHINTIQYALDTLKTVHATRYYASSKKDCAPVVKRKHHDYSVPEMDHIEAFKTSNDIVCLETQHKIVMPNVDDKPKDQQYIAAIECLEQMAENTNFAQDALNIRCADIEMMKILSSHAIKNGISLEGFEYTGTKPLSRQQQEELARLNELCAQECTTFNASDSYIQILNAVNQYEDRKVVKTAIAKSKLANEPLSADIIIPYSANTSTLLGLSKEQFFAQKVEHSFKNRGVWQEVPAQDSGFMHKFN